MKKMIFSLGLAVLMLASGCTEPQSSTDDLKLVNVSGDRIIYDDLKSLDNASDLIVLGKYVQSSEQKLEYEYSAEFDKDILVDAVSSNIISVSEVLKGETSEKELKISQRYGMIENGTQLISFSEMTPMQKNDYWIFFLYYDSENNTYWCAGDYSGRYPLPTDEINNILSKASDSDKQMEELLTNKPVLSEDEASQARDKGEYVFTYNDGKNYLVSNENHEILSSVSKELSTLNAGLKTSDFGVYNQSQINLQLYIEIISTYDIE